MWHHFPVVARLIRQSTFYNDQYWIRWFTLAVELLKKLLVLKKLAGKLFKSHQIEKNPSNCNIRPSKPTKFKVAVWRLFPVVVQSIQHSLFYNVPFLVKWLTLAAKLLKPHQLQIKFFNCILRSLRKTYFEVVVWRHFPAVVRLTRHSLFYYDQF